MERKYLSCILILAVLCSMLGCASPTYTCEECGSSSVKKVYYGMSGDEIMCEDCARVYWLPLDYKQFRYEKLPSQSAEDRENIASYTHTGSEADDTGSKAAAPFIPDYRPGKENTQSIPKELRFSEYSLPLLMQQDQTFYYYNHSSQCISKFSFSDDGTITDPVEVYEDYDMMLNAQVVGDWIYYIEPGGPQYELYRVRTDGAIAELVTDQVPDRGRGIYYAIGKDNAVYYPAMWSTQSSASEHTYYSGLYRLSLDAPDAEPELLFSEEIRNEHDGFQILTYCDGMFVLEREGSNIFTEHVFYLYYVGQSEPEPAPSWVTDFVTFYPQQNGSLITHTDTQQTREMDTVSLVWPNDPHNPIFLMKSPTTGYSKDKAYMECFCTDGDAIYYAQYSVRNENDSAYGLFRFDGTTAVQINRDVPTHIEAPGDGYIYYSCDDDHDTSGLYRVRPDGTGWEELQY